MSLGLYFSPDTSLPCPMKKLSKDRSMRGRRKRKQGNAEGGAGHGNGEHRAGDGKCEIRAAHRGSRGDPCTSRSGAQAPPDDAAILGAAATTPLKEVAVNADVWVTPLATGKKYQAPATDTKCYVRRRAAPLEVAAPSSCPAFSKRHRSKRPRESCSSIENATSDTDVEEDAPKAKSMFPFQKKFVEEQKAYYAEVDAFELQEEDSQNCSQ